MDPTLPLCHGPEGAVAPQKGSYDLLVLSFTRETLPLKPEIWANILLTLLPLILLPLTLCFMIPPQTLTLALTWLWHLALALTGPDGSGIRCVHRWYMLVDWDCAFAVWGSD